MKSRTGTKDLPFPLGCFGGLFKSRSFRSPFRPRRPHTLFAPSGNALTLSVDVCV